MTKPIDIDALRVAAQGVDFEVITVSQRWLAAALSGVDEKAVLPVHRGWLKMLLDHIEQALPNTLPTFATVDGRGMPLSRVDP